jgi:hypothetical protein
VRANKSGCAGNKYSLFQGLRFLVGFWWKSWEGDSSTHLMVIICQQQREEYNGAKLRRFFKNRNNWEKRAATKGGHQLLTMY